MGNINRTMRNLNHAAMGQINQQIRAMITIDATPAAPAVPALPALPVASQHIAHPPAPSSIQATTTQMARTPPVPAPTVIMRTAPVPGPHAAASSMNPAYMHAFMATHNTWNPSFGPGGGNPIPSGSGSAFPLDINDGLSYLQCRMYTDEEFDKLPHVIMTSDVTWDPSILDCTILTDNKWHNAVLDLGRSTSNPFEEFGRYTQRQEGPPIPLPVVGTSLRRAHPCQTLDIHYMITSAVLDHVRNSSPTITPQDHDFTTLRPFFLWAAPSLIAQT
jgi:hypothetical protein